MAAALSSEGVDAFAMPGDPCQSLFLLHRASRTLLECDVLYKYAFAPPASTGLPTNTAFGSGWRAAVCECSPNQRLPVYRFAALDKSSPLSKMSPVKPDRCALKHALQSVLDLPFDRIVSAHDGELNKEDFVEGVRQEYDWL